MKGQGLRTPRNSGERCGSHSAPISDLGLDPCLENIRAIALTLTAEGLFFGGCEVEVGEGGQVDGGLSGRPFACRRFSITSTGSYAILNSVEDCWNCPFLTTQSDIIPEDKILGNSQEVISFFVQI